MCVGIIEWRVGGERERGHMSHGESRHSLTSSWFLCGRIVCCFSNQGDLLMFSGEVCLGGEEGEGLMLFVCVCSPTCVLGQLP